MNVLYLTYRLPFPPVGGDRVRSLQFIKHLSRRHSVTVASFVEHADETWAAEHYREFYHRLIAVPLSRSRSHLNCLRGLASTKPLQAHYYTSDRMRAALADEVARQSYDVVISHTIRMMRYMDDVPARKVVDLCDAYSLFYHRCSQLNRGLRPWRLIHAVEAKRVFPYEAAAIGSADASLFISSVDGDHHRHSTHAERIVIVGNGVDANAFPFHSRGYDADRIVYMGHMPTFQNTDAASYFVKDIFPLIRKARPSAVLYIVGNAPPGRVRALHDGKSVIVTGRVDSVVPYLSSAAVAVAPMRAVVGVQNKILESVAVGTPVVTTSRGAEGLEHDLVEIADTPGDFARATLELMSNPAKRRERALAGRVFIEAHYTWEKRLRPLDGILDADPAGAVATSGRGG